MNSMISLQPHATGRARLVPGAPACLTEPQGGVLRADREELADHRLSSNGSITLCTPCSGQTNAMSKLSSSAPALLDLLLPDDEQFTPPSSRCCDNHMNPPYGYQHG